VNRFFQCPVCVDYRPMKCSSLSEHLDMLLSVTNPLPRMIYQCAPPHLETMAWEGQSIRVWLQVCPRLWFILVNIHSLPLPPFHLSSLPFSFSPFFPLSPSLSPFLPPSLPSSSVSPSCHPSLLPWGYISTGFPRCYGHFTFTSCGHTHLQLFVALEPRLSVLPPIKDQVWDGSL